MSEEREGCAERPGGRAGSVAAALCHGIGTLILLSVIAACVPITLPRLFGYGVYHVVSGSMEPQIPVGSVIYVKETPPEDLREGDVAAFWSGGSVIAHRVVKNRTVESRLETKGDANAEVDVNKVPYDAVIGRVSRHLPLPAGMAELLSDPVGKAYLICFAACGAMFHILAGRLRERRREE